MILCHQKRHMGKGFDSLITFHHFVFPNLVAYDAFLSSPSLQCWETSHDKTQVPFFLHFFLLLKAEFSSSSAPSSLYM